MSAEERPEGRRWWLRWLPDHLGTQLALILIAGLVAAQLLTGTIWHDVRRHQSMEVPVRVAAERLAQLTVLARQGLLDSSLVAALQTNDFGFELRSVPPGVIMAPPPLARDAEHLLHAVLTHLTGTSMPVAVTALSQVPMHGMPESRSWLDRLSGHPAMPETMLQIQAELMPDVWVLADVRAQQGWQTESQAEVFWDYFLRIYLLRMLLLGVVVIYAVRLVVRPVNQLAAAAHALGSNLRRSPLPLTGPVEARRASAAFNTMQARLEAHVAERTRFLAAVSHDLRSPITRLRLRTEMLPESPLKDKFRDDLTQMEALVNVTLDFVQGGRADEGLSRVDLDSMLSSLASDMDETGSEVVIEGSCGAALPGYPRSLKRCFQNLLENAVRYGDRARVRLLSQPDAAIVIISDDGPGIPEALLTRVLEPYFRAEPSRNAQTGGYGLGLSIAQAVVSAHGGSLVLRNRKDGGLDAEVRLPRA